MSHKVLAKLTQASCFLLPFGLGERAWGRLLVHCWALLARNTECMAQPGYPSGGVARGIFALAVCNHREMLEKCGGPVPLNPRAAQLVS